MNTNSWFEVKLKYVKESEDGTLKNVTLPFMVDAVSFGEAEERMYGFAEEFCRGSFTVTSIKRDNIEDILLYEDDDVWYRVVVSMLSINEDSGREANVSRHYLVTAPSVKEAHNRVTEYFTGNVVATRILSVKETNIEEIYPYVPVEA